MTTVLLDFHSECLFDIVHTFRSNINPESIQAPQGTVHITPPSAPVAAGFDDYRVIMWTKGGSLLHEAKVALDQGRFTVPVPASVRRRVHSMAIVGTARMGNRMSTLSLEITASPLAPIADAPRSVWPTHLRRANLQTLGRVPFQLRNGDSIRIEGAFDLIQALEGFDLQSARFSAHCFGQNIGIRHRLNFMGEDFLLLVEDDPREPSNAASYRLDAKHEDRGRSLEVNCTFTARPRPTAHPGASDVVRCEL